MGIEQGERRGVIPAVEGGLGSAGVFKLGQQVAWAALLAVQCRPHT